MLSKRLNSNGRELNGLFTSIVLVENAQDIIIEIEEMAREDKFGCSMLSDCFLDPGRIYEQKKDAEELCLFLFWRKLKFLKIVFSGKIAVNLKKNKSSR